MKILELVLKHFKNVVIGVLLLIAAGLAYEAFYYQETRIERALTVIQERDAEYAQLSSEHALLATNYRKEKDLHTEALKRWEKERKDLKGQIKALASATFTIDNFPTEQDAPDVVTDEYLKQEVRYKSADGKIGPPIGYVQIFSDTGRTISAVYSHQIQIDAVVTKDKDGRYRVLTKGSYILRDSGTINSDWKDVPYPLPITGGEFWVDPTSAAPVGAKKRFRQATKLNVGGFAGVSGLGLEAGAHAGVSLWGYGYTDHDLDFKLGEVGFNGSRGYLDVNVTPLQWRVGNVIPLIDDLYIGPGVGFGNHGVNYFIGLSTTL